MRVVEALKQEEFQRGAGDRYIVLMQVRLHRTRLEGRSIYVEVPRIGIVFLIEPYRGSLVSAGRFDEW